jgi:hypothetical protein
MPVTSPDRETDPNRRAWRQAVGRSTPVPAALAQLLDAAVRNGLTVSRGAGRPHLLTIDVTSSALTASGEQQATVRITLPAVRAGRAAVDSSVWNELGALVDRHHGARGRQIVAEVHRASITAHVRARADAVIRDARLRRAERARRDRQAVAG